MVSLKARLEQEACDAEEDTNEEQELAELESLASGGGGAHGVGSNKADMAMAALDTMSLTSDTPPGAQITWAGGACGALAYESVDELRVAVESLQRLHAELQEKATSLTARIEEARAADAAARTTGRGSGCDRDPIVACLLSAAESWMVLPRTISLGEEEMQGGGGGGSNSASLLLTLPASAGGQCDASSVRRGSLQSGRRNRRKTPGASSSGSKRGRATGGRIDTASGRGGTTMEDQDQLGPQQVSSIGGERSGRGTLAAAAKTPLRRRELFYHLVDAFREYQTRGTNYPRKAVSGGPGVDGEESVNRQERTEGDDEGSELPPIGVSSGGGGGGDGSGGDCAGAPASDVFSVSVRTLCDFGPPECRNASTQTVAKVGGNYSGELIPFSD